MLKNWIFIILANVSSFKFRNSIKIHTTMDSPKSNGPCIIKAKLLHFQSLQTTHNESLETISINNSPKRNSIEFKHFCGTKKLFVHFPRQSKKNRAHLMRMVAKKIKLTLKLSINVSGKKQKKATQL